MEWCADRFGPARPDQCNMHGGSYLCHESYCWGYRCAAQLEHPRQQPGEYRIPHGWRSGLRCDVTAQEHKLGLVDS